MSSKWLSANILCLWQVAQCGHLMSVGSGSVWTTYFDKERVPAIGNIRLAGEELLVCIRTDRQAHQNRHTLSDC